ncbi:DEKNAAC103584 [Brettanomyces naardenensis]|uniref:V-type proton ATPase subunit C n=1 Tax=Brettanomyces naardenensis TaxID=13370 RepID=A0A448YNM4_BRENA|nr:DEKNAAC103584 [Brettanomyces naardenensis]
MSKPVAQYLLISLPKSVGSENSLSLWLEQSVNGGDVKLTKYQLPDFKVGTLDSLVEQSDELAKIDTQLHSSIAKVLEIVANVQAPAATAAGSSDTTSSATLASAPLPTLKIDNKTVDQYFETFQWNTRRYRLDKPTDELIKLISEEALNLDSDLKNAYSSYNSARSSLLAAQRKQTGDLTVKSLHDIVNKDDFVLGSEHLTTDILVIPKSLKKSFLDTYESITPFVVPRSAHLITEDAEYYLYGVTLFKKYEQQFLAAAREAKWIPREFNYSEDAINKMKNEYAEASREEASLKNDLTRLSREAYSEITSAWIHIKLLRTFVESVLRYGLPPDFLCFFLKLKNEKAINKAKKDLTARFGYLGGNAFSTDKKGKVTKDNSLHEYASLVDQDYEPFVLYHIELY